MKQLHFEISDSFTVRLPNQSLDEMIADFNIFNETKISRNELIALFINDTDFMKKLKVASPTLYSSVMNYQSKSEKDINNIVCSVLKYYIRSYSRPTPFGLFSSVAGGKFQDDEQSKIDTGSFISKVRVSEEWLGTFVRKLEQDDQLFLSLQLKTNELLLDDQHSYYLPYYIGSKEDDKGNIIKESNVKKTKLLQFTLGSFRNGSKVEQFLASLAHANIEREEVIAYVKSLLKQEFLISNLRISQSVPNTLQALKEILLDMGECAEQYIPIIDELLNLEAGIDYSNFEGLEQQLEAIEKANEYFQYDSYYLTPLQFPNHLKQELSQYAQVLYKISQLIEDNHQNMHYYLQRFVDRYGTFVAVPVTTLIHDKTELGAPPMYINPTSVLDYEYYNSKQFMDSSNNGFVYQLLYKLSQSRGEQLDIKELLDSFPLADSESRIGSADIYVSVYRDEEQYKVFPSGNIFSPFASRTAGRFLYGLDTDMQDEILTDHEQKMSKVMKDDNLVNVTLFHLLPRSSNVTKAPSIAEYELAIGSNINSQKKALSLQDIYIYTDGKRFYFYSKELKAHIKPNISHMLNHQINSPNVYRFLLDIEMINNFPTQSFYWGKFEDKPYLPRIVYNNNFVIMPRLWNLKWEEGQDIHQYINQFVEEYNVPRYVKIMDFDNFILIDLEERFSRELLVKELKSKKQIRLAEAEEIQYESILQTKDHKNYVNELVYSLYVSSSQEKNEPVLTYYEQNNDIRIGWNWVYVKLYHHPGKEIKLLTQYFPQLAEAIQAQYFYIKYADPKPHIRLRVKVNEDNESFVYQILNQIIKELYSKKLIYHVSYEMYIREVERYGGSTGIQYAEEVFIVDTQIALQLTKYFEQNPDLKYALLTQFSVVLLRALLAEKQLYQWLENRVTANREHYKFYREHIKHKEVDASEIQLVGKELLTSWTEVMKTYSEVIKQEVGFDQIVASIWHMHCNRLGIHNEEEEKMISSVYYFVKEQHFKQQNKVYETSLS